MKMPKLQEIFTTVAIVSHGETETKRALDYLKMPKLQEIFTTVAIVSHRYGA